MVERFERFSTAIFEITRYWHKIAADEMTKYGLKGSHAVYLITLYRYPDGVTAAELGELCGKDKADVSRMLSIMEERGIIHKECSNRSRYRALIKLTGEGKVAAEQIRLRASKAVELGGSGISEAQRIDFYETLELIASNLEKLSREGLPKQ